MTYLDMVPLRLTGLIEIDGEFQLIGECDENVFGMMNHLCDEKHTVIVAEDSIIVDGEHLDDVDVSGLRSLYSCL